MEAGDGGGSMRQQRVLLWNLDPATVEALTAGLAGPAGRFTVVGSATGEWAFRQDQADLVICSAADWARACCSAGLGDTPASRGLTAGDTPASRGLTRREKEVLGLVADGLNSRQIARALQISLKTVQTHRAHLREKLGAHDRVDLVKMAICLGLATVGSRRGQPVSRPDRSADR